MFLSASPLLNNSVHFCGFLIYSRVLVAVMGKEGVHTGNLTRAYEFFFSFSAARWIFNGYLVTTSFSKGFKRQLCHLTGYWGQGQTG